VQEKAHARIINDACWWTGGFATASRDKTVKLWTTDGECKETIKLDEGATAVDAVSYNGRDILAIGLESGTIVVYDITDQVKELSKR
jgi:WD40 repeat protein